MASEGPCAHAQGTGKAGCAGELTPLGKTFNQRWMGWCINTPAPSPVACAYHRFLAFPLGIAMQSSTDSRTATVALINRPLNWFLSFLSRLLIPYLYSFPLLNKLLAFEFLYQGHLQGETKVTQVSLCFHNPRVPSLNGILKSDMWYFKIRAAWLREFGWVGGICFLSLHLPELSEDTRILSHSSAEHHLVSY